MSTSAGGPSSAAGGGESTTEAGSSSLRRTPPSYSSGSPPKSAGHPPVGQKDDCPAPGTTKASSGGEIARRQRFYVEEDSSSEGDEAEQFPITAGSTSGWPVSAVPRISADFPSSGDDPSDFVTFPHPPEKVGFTMVYQDDDDDLSQLMSKNLHIPRDNSQSSLLIGQNPTLTAQYSNPHFPPSSFVAKQQRLPLEEITGQEPFAILDDDDFFTAGPSSSSWQRDHPQHQEEPPLFFTVDEQQRGSDEIMQISDDQVITRAKPPKIVYGYLFGSDIGSGSYARVKDCINVKTLCRRAVKIVKMERLKRILHALTDVKRELRLLSRLAHKNVIRMYEYHWSRQKNKLYIFLEFCVTSLQQLLLTSARNNRLADWQSRFYFIQLLDGLEYLHSKGVCHKDIKPGNLLLTLDHVLKIVDFGVSDELDPFQADFNTTYTRGTPQFTSPEVAKGQRSFDGRLVDVWCSGVTLYNMASGRYPYEGETLFILYDNISNLPVDVPPGLIADERLRNLLLRMLEKDPQTRYGLPDVRRHEWVLRSQPRDPKTETQLPRRDMDDLVRHAMTSTPSVIINY